MTSLPRLSDLAACPNNALAAIDARLSPVANGMPPTVAAGGVPNACYFIALILSSSPAGQAFASSEAR